MAIRGICLTHMYLPPMINKMFSHLPYWGNVIVRSPWPHLIQITRWRPRWFHRYCPNLAFATVRGWRTVGWPGIDIIVNNARIQMLNRFRRIFLQSSLDVQRQAVGVQPRRRSKHCPLNELPQSGFTIRVCLKCSVVHWQNSSIQSHSNCVELLMRWYE